MSDPTVIGAAAGAFLMAIGAFVKIFRSEKANKQATSEILDALKILRDIGTLKSDAIPGFAPECLQRAKDHGERIATAEADIDAMTSRFLDQDRRFDGLNQKIESIRHDMKGEFAELRKEIRERT